MFLFNFIPGSKVSNCFKLIIIILHHKKNNNNFLLTKGRTGEYWPEVVAVWTEHSKVCTKVIKSQCSPVPLEQARLVISLLYGTWIKLVYLEFAALVKKHGWCLFPWKWSGWQNPGQIGKLYLRTTLSWSNVNLKL